jgi:integrase
MSMPMLMRRMEMGRFTVHGFRSTFRDWAGDCTNFARELIEAALAHMIENKAERAYRRSTAFEKRERLMAAWPATVIDRRPAPTDRWPPRTLQNRCVPST